MLITEEAEALLSMIYKHQHKDEMHLLAYSAPVTKEMVAFSNPHHYEYPPLPSGHEIPQLLAIELGIFAGRLYMEYEEYMSLVAYVEDSRSGSRPCTSEMKMKTFLREWLSLLRKGQDFTHSPMGYLCQGRQLNSDHDFFANKQDNSKGVLDPFDSKDNKIKEASGEGDEYVWEGHCEDETV